MKKILSLTLALVMLVCSMIIITSCDNSEDTEKTFTFVAVHADGTSKTFEITSKREMLGDALVDEGLIAGENGAYGLYVKTVDGETLDYDKDGKYWSLYIGDDYAMTGVDTTKIEDGVVYYFKAENAF